MKKKCYLSNEDILAKFEDPQAFLAAVDALVEAKYSNLPPKQKNSIKAFVKNEKLQQIWEALLHTLLKLTNHSTKINLKSRIHKKNSKEEICHGNRE